MKRVLVFGMNDNPGGVESVIMNYYRNIPNKDIHFDFLTNCQKIAYEDEIIKNGSKIYKITARSKDIKKYTQEINAFFKNNAQEYSTIWVNLCSLANIDYLKLAKKYGIKKRIIHAHNSQNMDSKIRGLLHKVNKILLSNYATDYWSCSQDATNYFYTNKIRNINKIVTINNAIDIEKYKFNNTVRQRIRKDLKIENNIVIGNVGRLHFQKNQSFLIDIFSMLSKIHDNLKLILVGEGEDHEKLENKVKELNLDDKVLFLGAINNVDEILQAFDLFVFPSLFEGLPVTLIEAQISGLKVFVGEKRINSKANINNNKYYVINPSEDRQKWVNIISENLYQYERDNIDIDLIKKSGYDIKEETKKIINLF